VWQYILLVNRVETFRNIVSNNVIKNVIRLLNRASAYLILSVKTRTAFFSSMIKNMCLERREVILIGLTGNIAHCGLTNKSHAILAKSSKPISMCIFAIHVRLNFLVWFEDMLPDHNTVKYKAIFFMMITYVAIHL